MKKIILFLWIPISIKAQEINSKKQNSEFVNAESSMVIPIGKLANKFDYAQSYGFWFKIGQDNGLAANVGFDVLFLQKPRTINYKCNDSIYKIKSNKFGLDIGIRAVKVIPLIKKNNYLELDTTLGIHYLDYDFPCDIKDNKNKKNDPFLKNSTLLLAPELKYIINNFGFKMQYRYTPFNFIEAIEPKFGSHSIAFGIVYKQ